MQNVFIVRIFSLYLLQHNKHMSRRRRLRKIVKPPGFKGYKPYGTLNDNNEFIELLYEEYEALKLADYDLMNQKQASSLMGVSRATFARIYESARRKIAQALVDTKEIKTVYGNVWLDKNWFICLECQANFTIPPQITNRHCPLCKNKNIESIK